MTNDEIRKQLWEMVSDEIPKPYDKEAALVYLKEKCISLTEAEQAIKDVKRYIDRLEDAVARCLVIFEDCIYLELSPTAWGVLGEEPVDEEVGKRTHYELVLTHLGPIWEGKAGTHPLIEMLRNVLNGTETRGDGTDEEIGEGPVAKRAYTMDEACKYLGGISRPTMYKLPIPSFKIGRRRYFLGSELDGYIDRRLEEAEFSKEIGL